MVPSNHSAAGPLRTPWHCFVVHNDGILAIEVLALIALYFQSIDMRCVTLDIMRYAGPLLYYIWLPVGWLMKYRR